MNTPFVIVIAGPPAVGKTTIINMLQQRRNCTHISEDELAKELYPYIYINIEEYPDKLEIVKQKLLERMVDAVNNGKSVITDRINLDKQFVQKVRNLFGNSLIIKVLLPPIQVTIDRDKKRDCWTSGEKVIREFYKQYEELKSFIGAENYIDNSNQSSEETLEHFITAIG